MDSHRSNAANEPHATRGFSSESAPFVRLRNRADEISSLFRHERILDCYERWRQREGSCRPWTARMTRPVVRYAEIHGVRKTREDGTPSLATQFGPIVGRQLE